MIPEGVPTCILLNLFLKVVEFLGLFQVHITCVDTSVP